jgi:alpha-1,2-mannosyltransferase
MPDRYFLKAIPFEGAFKRGTGQPTMSASEPVATARPERLVTPAELYSRLTVAAAVFFVVLEGCYFVTSFLHSGLNPPVDVSGYAIGRDFINVWMGGRSAFAGGPAPWFDLPAYNDAITALFGTQLPPHYWSYPPHLLLFTWPFGLMTYLAAYALWCAAGVALYVLAAADGDFRRDHLLFLAMAPGVAVCVFFGQNGFFTAALLIAGLNYLDRRPLVAGVLFGILTVKPQLGLLLPLMLVVTGHWRTIAAAVVTTAVLIALTSALYGVPIWSAYLDKVGPQQNWLLTEGGGLLQAMVCSPFAAVRLTGLSLAAAWAAQAFITASAIGAVAWTYWRRRDPVLSTALLITATFLATPWSLTYDLVVLGWVVDLLRRRGDNTVLDHRLAIAVWTLPVTAMIAGAVHVPLAFLVLVAFLARLVWRLSR